MPHSPALVLVDPMVEPRTASHSAFRRGLPSAIVGVAVGAASILPFLLSVLTH